MITFTLSDQFFNTVDWIIEREISLCKVHFHNFTFRHLTSPGVFL